MGDKTIHKLGYGIFSRMSLQAVAVWILAFALVSVGVVDLKSRQPGEWKDFHHAYLLVVGNGRGKLNKTNELHVSL